MRLRCSCSLKSFEGLRMLFDWDMKTQFAMEIQECSAVATKKCQHLKLPRQAAAASLEVAA